MWTTRHLDQSLRGWDLYFFLVPHLRHIEVPRLGIQSELQLPAYTTAAATRDLSCIFDLHHSSRQRQILNPLSKSRDWTWTHGCLSDSFPLSHSRNSTVVCMLKCYVTMFEFLSLPSGGPSFEDSRPNGKGLLVDQSSWSQDKPENLLPR